ncbi:MAG: TolC family protein [Candidatus Limisoma sp.]|nr:TolC family protein [Muribaculaceae bacterium]MDD6868963.1 TolC family protein [bacterium]MDY5826923.1 TolC family protein [Candidatus Limisoma sp.]
MKISKYISVVLVVAIATTATGCHIYKKFEMPDEGIAKEVAEAQKEPIDSTALGNLKWDEVFTDPQLQALIQIALDNNVDLENARLNVEIANAQLLGSKLSYLPSVALTPNGGTASYGGSKITRDTWQYTIPATASWELDLFGKLLNGKRSAQAAVLQSEAYRQAVRSQIIGGVANCYYTIVMLQQQLQILNETSAIWKESITTMQDLKEAGRFNEVAVVQSKANYSSLLATIPQIEMSIHEAQNSLSLLLNRQLQSWQVDASYTPVFPKYMENDIPLKYVASRPDVQAAEQSLAMAYYATNSARAAFYPTIALSVNGGFTNYVGGMISNPGSWFYQLAGQLAAPLFSRGQNIATLKAAKARQEQSLNNFEYTVLAAGAEVSDALVAYNKNLERASQLEAQVGYLKQAVEYNNDLLKYGTATYLEVLTAQQSLLNAQISQAQCQLSARQAAISLYQSLGGGR